MNINSKEHLQEVQYHFPYHHLTHEQNGGFFLFRHLFWGLEHYTYIKFVIDKIANHSFKTLADIGCGEGRILLEISSEMPGTDMYGYDVSETALHFARGFTQSAKFNTQDITKEPLPDKVDAVVSCEVIEHIIPDEVDNYCKNIALSLNENGLFFLTTPTTNIPVIKKHYQHFTRELLEKHLSPYFVIEEVIFLNKKNILDKILNRIIANRLYLSNIPSLNGFVLKLYKKYCLVGKEDTGSRIYIRARKK